MVDSHKEVPHPPRAQVGIQPNSGPPPESFEQKYAALEAKYVTLRAAFERQMRESALLERVRTALARELDLSALLRTIVEEVAETFNYQHVSLYLLEGEMLVMQYQVGYELPVERIPITQGVSGRVVRTGEPVLIEDVTTVPEFIGATEGIVSEICVPLFDSGMVVGIFNVESTAGVRLGGSDLGLMVALSEHIDLAISRARLHAQLRQREETFRQLFEHAPIAVVLSSLDSRIMQVNRAACDLFGYTADELQSMTVADISVSEDEAINRGHRKELIQGLVSNFKMDKRYIAKDGHIIYAIIQVTLLRDAHGQPMQVLGQVVDISDLKAAQTQLQALNDELELRIQHRTRELEAANRRLLDLDALKNRFIGDISHELRTPLANINTRLYLLEHDKEEQFNKHLSVLKTHTSRLHVMVEEIMDFSRMQTADQPWVFTSLYLNDLIEQLKVSYLPRAAARSLALTFDLQPQLAPISGNVEHLQRLVTNLLDNALKYTPAGHIQVRTYADTDEREVVLEVSDTGRGIDPSDIPHLFERFYRGRDIGSSNIPGTGLGLAIAKEISERHGGTIEVRSTPNVGSTFRVRLPILSAGLKAD